jgi:hypothetical protein
VVTNAFILKTEENGKVRIKVNNLIIGRTGFQLRVSGSRVLISTVFYTKI